MRETPVVLASWSLFIEIFCSRGSDTTLGLSAIGTTDFFYICASHLSDRGFATLLNPQSATPVTPPGPSKADIGKVIAEYEAKEKRRKEAAKKDGDDDDEKKGADGKGKDAAAAPGGYLTPTTTVPSAPTHEIYELHRQVFVMRLEDAKKRSNTAQVRSLACCSLLSADDLMVSSRQRLSPKVRVSCSAG